MQHPNIEGDELAFLGEGGEVGRLIRVHDWSKLPLGPPALWPQSLKTVTALLLNSKFPMFLAWGHDLRFLYNDAYAEILGSKHPRALGSRFYDIWSEVWPDIYPLIERAMAGESTFREDLPLTMNRHGFEEQTWFTFSYSPLRDDTAKVAGMFCACTETTGQILTARRRDAMAELDDRLRDVANVGDLSFVASELLGKALNASRVAYGTIDDEAGTITIDRSWCAKGITTVAGTYNFDEYGTHINDLRAGRAVANNDVEKDPRTATAAAAFRSLHIRAHLDVPVTENGRAVSEMFVHSSTPRVWTDEEISFARHFAERTHAAIARRRAADALVASEAKFEAITNSIDQMIWSTKADGYHDYFNDRWYEYTGVAKGATDGKAWNDVFHPDDKEYAWSTWRKSLETGDPYHIEYRLRHRSGEYRWVIGRAQCIRDSQGRIVRWFGTCTDVHDLKIAEQNLRKESRRLETLNRTGAAVAGELDLERVVQMVTDAGVELTGAAFGAFFYNVQNDSGESYMLYTLSGVERSAFERFPMPRKTQVFGPTFNGDGTVRSTDILSDPRYGHNAPHNGMPNGHLPVRSYLAVPVTSRSGEVIGGLFFGHPEPEKFLESHEGLIEGLAGQAAVAIDNARLYQDVRRANDTLEQRVIERTAELEAAHEALRQSQKMETVGQLTGGVAHDFNNLLQIVTGNLETLQRNMGDGSPRLKRAVENAMTGAKRAATLTQRLLAFSRRQPLSPKPVNANRLVLGMSELLHRTLGEIIQLETVLASGLWRIEADPNQLENAILNLALNARDAMPDGGKLTIETSNTHLDRSYTARTAEVLPGQYVAICVSDTGTGMDADVQARVFEPFFTTKEVGKGTGLGLSMVYGFVKQSGGHVKIYSEIGHGTTVKIYLPRLVGSVDEESEATERLIPEGGKEETILVCEDDDDVRTYSVEALRELGYRVIEAHDGASALRLLERQEGRVDLLFSDVVLPGGMSGADLASAARGLRPNLKVLFTTGYARDAIVHHGRLDAGVELITKPFSFLDLATRVRDLLDKPR